MNTLGNELDSALKESLAGQNVDVSNAITNSLEKAFDQVEGSFLEVAKKAYELGFSNPGIYYLFIFQEAFLLYISAARVGSCVLSALIHNNKVYVANAGDSAGVICRLEKNEVKCLKVNKKLNAASKKEQARLRGLFNTEPDIVICRRVGIFKI